MSVQQSIFVRPRSVRHVADLARAQFGHPSSDHLTYLNALNAYMRMKKEETKKEEATKGAGLDPKKWCMDHFLSYGILEEVLRIREQLARMLGKYGYDFTSAAFGTPDYEIKIRKALALSFFHQAAIKVSGEGTCKTIHHDVPALIHWDSMLAEGDIEWIVYNRFTFTGGKQYIQTITAIEPEWIMVCNSTYSTISLLC
ncbi:uncharacterized protein F4822DRAFT_152194 [Hypoxylon trugodes]|uniref:uncharacterized protein n=1 Tax=Hypoxylon trugodes TaxID=326681 RepID=UPI002193FF9B|nr:uncharacterized protein F4822DRAFT_152194 [Hypoxylon trugodes]KAI1390492.1 hypothetical protein F4822DRAFT_152194 [Hypoxylon trugodes]